MSSIVEDDLGYRCPDCGIAGSVHIEMDVREVMWTFAPTEDDIDALAQGISTGDRYLVDQTWAAVNERQMASIEDLVVMRLLLAAQDDHARRSPGCTTMAFGG